MASSKVPPDREEMRDRLRPTVMRELRWLVAVGVVVGIAVVAGVVTHSLWPRSGLLPEITFAIALYPLYKFVHFGVLEGKIAKDPSSRPTNLIGVGWVNEHPLMAMATITGAVALTVVVFAALRG